MRGVILVSPPHNRSRTVTLEPGEILVFRFDLFHAGAAYNCIHHRMHFFGDVTKDCSFGPAGGKSARKFTTTVIPRDANGFGILSNKDIAKCLVDHRN